jgi:Domain of unknown function (DUF6378)
MNLLHLKTNMKLAGNTMSTQEKLPLLQEAHNLIHGQRQADYGPPHQNFTQIAVLWTALLATKLTKKITPTEVAFMMQQLKVARLLNQPTHHDSLVDGVAYGALAEVIQQSQASGTPLPGILGEIA